MTRLRLGWIAAVAGVAGVRLWNGITGPLLRGYDDHGHVGYVLFLDLYRSVPWADQGWSYFHPPLHYLFGWVLAQIGSAEALLHGLALLNGLWSLAIAYLAARVTRLACPDREDLPLLVFTSVGLLPVYLYTSTMAGNELTAAFFGTLAFALLVANESRGEPQLRTDALVGLLLGLALLSKVNAVLVLGAAGLSLGFRLLRAESFVAALPRIVIRGVVLAGIALVVASPYYIRNLSEFGTPLKMSRDNPHVARLESLQGPGSRTWVDFVLLPPKLLLDPNPRAEHLLHSVWGSAYAQTWADPRLSWDNLPGKDQPRIHTTRSAMVILGLGPSVLALIGAVLAILDVARRRRRAVYVPMFCLAGVSLASFAYFAVEAPMYSALKASYLLGLTLPYGLFLARGVESLGQGSLGAWRRSLAVGVVVVPALAAALVHADGVLLPRLGDHKAIGSLRFHFGDLDAASRHYRKHRRSLLAPKAAWNEELASVALVRGDPFEARSLLEPAGDSKKDRPFRWNMLAVATALAGDRDEAREMIDRALEAGAGEVALTNRGVLRASLGELAAAESDLRAALEIDDSLAPTWHALAEVLRRSGRAEAASEARARSLETAARAPRGYPYGIPDGLGQYPSFSLGLRWLLWLDGDELALARAPFRGEDAVAMQDPAL